jgi:hypothetical protein
MRNREYHRRAVRQAIDAEIARGYYRPAQPVRDKFFLVRGGNAPRPDSGPHQLSLDFDPPQPLADIFPEAYET